MHSAIDIVRTRTPPRQKEPADAETDRARFEAAVLASEQRHRQLIDALPAAVYTCDADGRISSCNLAAIELWGRRPVLGVDKWNGAYRVYQPDGTLLPLEEVPAARAL